MLTDQSAGPRRYKLWPLPLVLPDPAQSPVTIFGECDELAEVALMLTGRFLGLSGSHLSRPPASPCLSYPLSQLERP